MAPTPPIEQREPGAPVARDAIDPELVKLARSKPKIGIITAAGVLFLCVWFVLRLDADRRFAGSADQPVAAAVDDIVHDRIATEQQVKITGEPLIAGAIRVTNAKGSLGLRLMPVRGASDLLWIAASGDGWDAPAPDGYVGRLRKLDELPFAEAARARLIEQPQPLFATVAALRAGAAAGTVTTVSGDNISPKDGDKVAADVIDPDNATIVMSFTDRLPDAAAWRAALDKAGLYGGVPAAPGKADDVLGELRLMVALPVATTTSKLEAAGLWAARVEPVTRHLETTWGAVRAAAASHAASLGLGSVPDAQLDVVGVYVARALPAGAYVVVTGELPDDYWYVMPVTIALAVLSLIFAWALVRAIRRDLLPARAG
jgi:hypothetical protein